MLQNNSLWDLVEPGEPLPNLKAVCSFIQQMHFEAGATAVNKVSALRMEL